jgi:PhnB protein
MPTASNPATGLDRTLEEPMAFYPYLNFAGNCRAAFNRYQEILGGELVLLPMSEIPTDEPVPEDQSDLIAHAALMIEDGGLLMGSDVPGDFDGMRGVYVNYSLLDTAEAERVFKELADGGEIEMPIGETFWSPRFGICVDRFGTPWMVNAQAPEQQFG